MRDERGLVLLLCAFAAARVLLFALAFPPFHPIDELAHFDVVLKYAHGGAPSAIGGITPEATELYMLYGWGAAIVRPSVLALQKEPEYREAWDALSRVPIWSLPAASRAGAVQFLQSNEEWRRNRNHEDTQPPLYYALAGAWDRIGAALRVGGGSRVYWIRLLGVPFAALLVWLGWRLALQCWPEGPAPDGPAPEGPTPEGCASLRLGVPVLLAALPQDCLYGISNDALSPPLFAAAFVLLAAMMAGPLAWPSALAAGALAAAAVLTKNTNLVIAVPLAVAALASLRRLRQGGRRGEIASLAALGAAAVLPVALWWTRSWMVAGDPTGGRLPARALGWSLKAVSELGDHPVFHSGALVWPFWHDLMATYWRGELPWHGAPMSFTALDVLFSGSSAVFLALAAWQAWRARARAEGAVLGLGLASVLSAVGFLLALSVAVRFNPEASFLPSPGYPFFANGRLIGGTLVPFAVLYVAGLGRLTRRPLVIIVALALGLTVVEYALSLGVFRSPYNWFHLVTPR